MKKPIIAILALAAFAFAAPKCNLDSLAAYFEKKMGFESGMKGASVTHRFNEVIRWSRDESFREDFFIGLDCKLSNVVISVYDHQSRERLSIRTAVMRDDGESIKAVCEGSSSDVVIVNDDGSLSVNRDCICFDEDWNQVPSGRYGCLEEREIGYFRKLK